MISNLSQTLTLSIQDKATTNTYVIRVPDGGQMLDIENMKAALTLYYREMSDKGTVLSNLALDIVDMTAYFSILCPNLIRDLHVPISKLSLPDILQLRQSFTEQFIPWWNQWVSLINGVPLMDSEKTPQDEEDSLLDEQIHVQPNQKVKAAKDQDVNIDLT